MISEKICKQALIALITDELKKLTLERILQDPDLAANFYRQIECVKGEHVDPLEKCAIRIYLLKLAQEGNFENIEIIVGYRSKIVD